MLVKAQYNGDFYFKILVKMKMFGRETEMTYDCGEEVNETCLACDLIESSAKQIKGEVSMEHYNV